MGLTPTEDVSTLQFYLMLLSGFQCAVTTAFFLYYPWTRQFVFTYFASPTTYGVLTTERWNSLFWWICILTALQIFPLWYSGWMQVKWSRRSWKIFWIAYICVLLAIWLVTLGYMIAWLAQCNDPSQPNNPANSYRACCTPEFYNTVGACPNYGQPHPECDPGINLSELGTNPDFRFFFFIELSEVFIWGFYIWLGWAIIKPTELALAAFASKPPSDGSTILLSPGSSSGNNGTDTLNSDMGRLANRRFNASGAK